jgi:hypothetical protein
MKRNSSLDDDVTALFSEMKIKPITVDNSDVDALLQMRRVDSLKEGVNFERQRYINTIKNNHYSSSSSVQSIRHSIGRPGAHHVSRFSTESSRVAQLLDQSDHHAWVASARSTLRSHAEEMLFRSMKVVLPEKQVGSSTRRPSSAGGTRAISSVHTKVK